MTTLSASEHFGKILEQALSLPDEERRELCAALHQSLCPENDTSDEMLEKIKERIARIDRGEAKLIPSSEVKAELMRRLAERRK